VTPEESMLFIDTHCHLDDDAFETDLPAVLDAARAAGVNHYVNIGYEPESWHRTIELAQQFAGVSLALGMHPNSSDRWSNDTADELTRLLDTSQAVAIGETGLDFYWDRVDHSSQHTAFHDQLELGRRFHLPVIIHMRGDVEGEIMATIARFPDVDLVFHSFDGTPRLRDIALERGAAIGVGGLMTRAGPSRLRDTLKAVPLDSIVLETDSPYLVPKGVKDRRNTPASIPLIAAALGDLLEVSAPEIAERTTGNAQRVFLRASAVATGGSA
jgi:TatD DNase family protein